MKAFISNEHVVRSDRAGRTNSVLGETNKGRAVAAEVKPVPRVSYAGPTVCIFALDHMADLAIATRIPPNT